MNQGYKPFRGKLTKLLTTVYLLTMNLLKSVYCNQYYELKPKGKGHAARANGTGLVTIGLIVNFFTVLLLAITISPDLGKYLQGVFIDMVGRQSGKGMGQTLAFLVVMFIYPWVKFTMGTQQNYQQTIDAFEKLSAEEQLQVSKKGLQYFIISLGLVIGSLVAFFVF